MPLHLSYLILLHLLSPLELGSEAGMKTHRTRPLLRPAVGSSTEDRFREAESSVVPGDPTGAAFRPSGSDCNK